MVAEIPMSTPQLAAAAPVKYCSRCGRPMQHIKTTDSTYHYACYAHTAQNSDGPGTYYFNLHYRIPLNPDGTIATKEVSNDPRRSR